MVEASEEFPNCYFVINFSTFQQEQEKKKLNCSNSAVHLTKKLFFTNLKQFHTLSWWLIKQFIQSF